MNENTLVVNEKQFYDISARLERLNLLAYLAEETGI
jgi:hypothetical protein